MLDEAAALEVHPRQPVRALRVAARDAHEVVLHAERLGVLRDAVRDHGRDRPQHELAEHHVVHDPLAVVEVAPGQDVGELLGPERLERPVVDRDSGERARDRLEQVGLHVGEARLGRDRRRDPSGDERHLLDVVVVETWSRIGVHVVSIPLAPGAPLADRGCVSGARMEELAASMLIASSP